jgi:hypothetical protein
MATKTATAKSTKTAYFVRTQDPNNSWSFFNITEHIGKSMPFSKIQATCAMQVKDDVIALSLLHTTKAVVATLVTNPVVLPRGPLERLDRRAAKYLELTDDELVVEFDGAVYHLSIARDDAGIARLELVSIDGYEGEEPLPEVFELPKGAIHMDLYLRSPKVARTIAVGFIGHAGKPGDPDTVSRCAAKVLNSISQLFEFRMLSSIETINVPAGPSKWSQQAAALRKVEKDAAVEVPVWLFSTPTTATEIPDLLGSGSVVVTVDLENANPATGRLLCHYAPSASLGDLFEGYRTVFDARVTSDLQVAIGTEDLSALAFDIVLGVIEPGAIERIEDALKTIKALDLTTSQVRDHA